MGEWRLISHEARPLIGEESEKKDNKKVKRKKVRK